MKAGKATTTASKAYATELEAINMKDTLTPLTRGIASCQMEDVNYPPEVLPSCPADLFTDEEFEEINAISGCNGKLQFKKMNYIATATATTRATPAAGNAKRKATCRESAYCVCATTRPWSTPAANCSPATTSMPSTPLTKARPTSCRSCSPVDKHSHRYQSHWSE